MSRPVRPPGRSYTQVSTPASRTCPMPHMDTVCLEGLFQSAYLLKPLEGRGPTSSSWLSGGMLAAAWKAVGAPGEAVPLAIFP